MTREDLDFIGSMNMCDEISNEAYKKIVCHFEGQEPILDKIKEEIKETAKDFDKFDDYRRVRGLWIALDIIDKYRQEVEE